MQPLKYAHGVLHDYRVNQSGSNCNAISDNISLRDRDNRTIKSRKEAEKLAT